MHITQKATIKTLNKFYFVLVALISPLLGHSSVTEIEKIAQLIKSDAPLLAIGTVSSIDTENSAIEVNGQKLSFDNVTEGISVDLDPTFGPITLVALEPGDYVAVTGEMIDPGHSLATQVIRLDNSYTEGATPTFIRAVIEDVQKDTGNAISGKSVIDYTAALYDYSIANLEPATIAEFYGTTYKTVFYATQGRVLDGQKEMGQPVGASALAGRGSGIRAGRGSGIRAGRGSGIRAGRGSGIR